MNSSSQIDQALEAFDPIGLTEMDAVSLMNRVDTKYVLDEETLATALATLAEKYRVLEIEDVQRSPYMTLYFDTPARDCYREHHNGKANRRKYRMRTYAASGVSFFEVKTKTNKGRTIKKRITIPMIDETLCPESTALAESIAGTSLSLSPQLWTNFRRITLVGRDTPERVTIDTDLEFQTDDQRVPLPNVVIAEVKQARASRDSAIRQTLRDLAVRPMRISKYCLGSALLDPTLKRNNFKRKLLALPLSPAPLCHH